MFLNVEMPVNFEEMLIQFRFSTFYFMPNFFTLLASVNAPLLENGKLESPWNFYNNGFDGYFFNVAGSSISILLIVFFCFLMLKLMVRLDCKDCIQNFFKKCKKKMEFGCIYDTFLSLASILIYGALLHLGTLNLVQAWSIFGMVMSIITLFLMVILGGISLIFIFIRPKKCRISFLVKEFRTNSNWSKLAPFCYLLRIILEPIILTEGYNSFEG